MALVEVLSTLERALELLTSNLGSLQQTGSLPSLVYTLNSLATTEGGGSASSAIQTGAQQSVLQAGLSLLPLGGSATGSPLSVLSFTPLGALASLFSDSEPAVASQNQTRENLAGLVGEPRESGVSASNDFGYPIDRNFYGQPRAVVDDPQVRPATQITVNVQTMDSRSFLDHSEDIAQALRRSLLTDNPLSEVF
jgi:hypothetical protein